MKDTKIILHPGPHKTGTTAVQEILNRAFGSGQVARVWYPRPEVAGPGHATLAWSIMGANGYEKNWSNLQQVCDLANSGCAEHLILSAEDFSYLRDIALTELRNVFRRCSVYLIFTASPIRSRCISLWQELLKHGYHLDTISSNVRIFSEPAMDPMFIDRFIKFIEPHKTFLVTSSKNLPKNTLPARFLEALEKTGISGAKGKLPSDICSHTNPSLGAVECAVLMYLNRIGAVQTDRNKILRSFNSSRWRENVDMLPLTIPLSWRPNIEKLKKDTELEIDRLAGNGQLEVVGSARDIFEEDKEFETSYSSDPITSMSEARLIEHFAYLALSLAEQ